MVIWSKLRLGQYRDEDHREVAPHFNIETNDSVFGESILNDGVAVVLFQVSKIRIDQTDLFCPSKANSSQRMHSIHHICGI